MFRSFGFLAHEDLCCFPMVSHRAYVMKVTIETRRVH